MDDPPSIHAENGVPFGARTLCHFPSTNTYNTTNNNSSNSSSNIRQQPQQSTQEAIPKPTPTSSSSSSASKNNPHRTGERGCAHQIPHHLSGKRGQVCAHKSVLFCSACQMPSHPATEGCLAHKMPGPMMLRDWHITRLTKSIKATTPSRTTPKRKKSLGTTPNSQRKCGLLHRLPPGRGGYGPLHPVPLLALGPKSAHAPALVPLPRPTVLPSLPPPVLGSQASSAACCNFKRLFCCLHNPFK